MAHKNKVVDITPTGEQESPPPDKYAAFRGPDGRLVADGTVLREWANGTIVDVASNKIVQAPPKDRQGINSTTAREFHQLYREKAIKAAMQGLIDGTTAKTPHGGWRTIVAAQARLAADESKARSSTEAARFVGQATGFMTGPGARGQEMPQSGAALLMSSDVAAELLRLLTQSQE